MSPIGTEPCVLAPAESACRAFSTRLMFREGGRYGWKPSSSSNVSIRVVRAYYLIGSKQTILYRASRADSISQSTVSSTLFMFDIVSSRPSLEANPWTRDLKAGGCFANAGIGGFPRVPHSKPVAVPLRGSRKLPLGNSLTGA